MHACLPACLPTNLISVPWGCTAKYGPSPFRRPYSRPIHQRAWPFPSSQQTAIALRGIRPSRLPSELGLAPCHGLHWSLVPLHWPPIANPFRPGSSTESNASSTAPENPPRAWPLVALATWLPSTALKLRDRVSLADEFWPCTTRIPQAHYPLPHRNVIVFGIDQTQGRWRRRCCRGREQQWWYPTKQLLEQLRQHPGDELREQRKWPQDRIRPTRHQREHGAQQATKADADGGSPPTGAQGQAGSFPLLSCWGC